MASDIDELAKQIADACEPMAASVRLQLTRSISAALLTERNKFDEKTNEALRLFGEHQIEMIAQAYEKASTYTNLVILAGYAGLFALWQFTKEHLSRGQSVWVALLALLSITVFVVYEIYKAYFTNRQLRDYAALFQDPNNTLSGDAVISALKTFDAGTRRITILAYRFWMIAFVTTTLTGLAAASVLAYAFIRLLLT